MNLIAFGMGRGGGEFFSCLPGRVSNFLGVEVEVLRIFLTKTISPAPHSAIHYECSLKAPLLLPEIEWLPLKYRAATNS